MKWKTGRGHLVGMTGWRHSNQYLFTAMLLSACISLYAAFVLSVDAVLLAANPDAVLTCDLNSVVSCGAVGKSWQAELFGFPNAFLGLMTEPVVITIAVASLSGVKFKRWFMFTAQFIYLLGLIFAYWLFYQSSFVIGSLCPYCMLITLGTTLVFFTLLHYNIRENNLYLSEKWQRKAEFFSRVGGDTAVAVLLLLSIVAIIFSKYGLAVFG